MNTYVNETRESTVFFTKETVGSDNYVYIEEEDHLLCLKCDSSVDLDSI